MHKAFLQNETSGEMSAQDDFLAETEFHHGGNTAFYAEKYNIPVSSILDFSANLNPLGPPPDFRSIISRSIDGILSYPDPHSLNLRKEIASSLSIPHDRILPGNGLGELIHVIPSAIRPLRIIIPGPSYSGYLRAASVSGFPILEMESPGFQPDYEKLESVLCPGDLIFLGHPSNPAGRLLDSGKTESLIRKFPDVTFVIDEAFIDFVSSAETFIGLLHFSNLIVLRSFTKIYTIPGLRLGYLAASSDIISRIKPHLPDWSVNSLSQSAGSMFLRDRKFILDTQTYTEEMREFLMFNLRKYKFLKAHDSSAPYILIQMENASMDACELKEVLMRDFGILIRDCGNYRGLDDTYFRIAVKNKEDNERLIHAFSEIFSDETSVRTSESTTAGRAGLTKRRTPSLMIQGTSSSAGKSILVSAVCRILLRQGVKVAPFKAQNMSLNSFVTRNGEEIARAQAVQAAACRLEPDIRMSPVLLKPNSENGSQVLVNGKPVGNMKAKEYQLKKQDIFGEIRKNYDSLASEYDAVVLEGAGSPGEVNLKKYDVVNMNMARYARSPVLIAGDIDRGGVFAGFIGTMEVLDEWARKLTAGFIVNRFRGDVSLLDDALRYTEDRTGKPVFGVVPFISNLHIPEEDSVAFKSHSKKSSDLKTASLRIAVIDLPSISNFTDFDPFYSESDVEVIIAGTPDEIINCDAVIIPGTKNTIRDMMYLNDKGFSAVITELAEEKKSEIIGICGGLQMLGLAVEDPHEIESGSKAIPGLGLLEIHTVHGEDKILRQTCCMHKPSGIELKGYEVHHGVTKNNNHKTVNEILHAGESAIGFSDREENIWGVYLHGIFDTDLFRRWFLEKLRRKKGLPASQYSCIYSLDSELDRLADIVEGNLNMNKIYEIMGI